MMENYGNYLYSYERMVDKLYTKDKGICALCGNKLNIKNIGSMNIDHLIPQSVFKYANTKGLNDLCNSMDNLILVHKNCNIRKGIDFLDVSMLYLSKQRKSEIQEHQKRCQPYIDKFNHLREEKVEEQGNECAICHKEIEYTSTIIRRLDCSKKRTYENSIGLCKECNKRYTKRDRINYTFKALVW